MHYYHGLFLPILSGEHWVIQLSVYYHSLFLTAVKGLAYLYEQSEQYYKMEALCMDVLQVENLDESIHCLLILSLIKQNKQKLALEHYITTAELLYSQFGTKPSKELQKLYEESLKQTNELEIDLGIIQNDLREASQVKGAFFCEYGVFKRIYNLQARQAKRMGISVYCGLITLKFNYQIAESSDMYIKKMKDAMDGLHTVIDETLRVGDVIARYSVCQYVLLLPTCAYENSITVMERIKKNYAATDKRQRILFHYDVKELTLQ